MSAASAIAASLAELEDALADGGIRVAPRPGQIAAPCAIVAGPLGTWAGLAQLGAGRIALTWRILLIAGLADNDAARDQLVTIAGMTIDVLRALPGYQLADLGRFGRIELGGGIYLAADVTVQTAVTVTD